MRARFRGVFAVRGGVGLRMYASGRSANEGRLLQAASWPWSE